MDSRFRENDKVVCVCGFQLSLNDNLNLKLFNEAFVVF